MNLALIEQRAKEALKDCIQIGWFNMNPLNGLTLQDGTEALVVCGDPQEIRTHPDYAEIVKQGVFVPADFWRIMMFMVLGQEFRFYRSVIPRWNQVLEVEEPLAYPFLKIPALPPEDQDWVFGCKRSPELMQKMMQLSKSMKIPEIPMMGTADLYFQYVDLYQAARKALSHGVLDLRSDMFGRGKSSTFLN